MFEVTVSVASCDSPGLNEKLVELITAVSPGSETVAESVTVPLKPKLLTVILVVLEVPAVSDRLGGFAETVKSLVILRLVLIVRVVPQQSPLTVRV